jgi:hypothetical protein
MAQLTANRGTGVPFRVFFKDELGDPFPLFDWSVVLLEVDTGLNTFVTAAIGDAAEGRVDGQVAWNNALPAGRYPFRVQITQVGELPHSTPLIEVVYQ